MSNDVKIDFNNKEKLLELFDDLKDSVQRSVGRQALRMSAKIILDAAKRNFNSVTKGFSKTNYREIKKSFKTKNFKNKLGVMLGNEYWKSRFIDGGTKERFYTTKKNNKRKSIGKITATNFWTYAVEQNKDRAVKEMENNLLKSLTKLVNKYEKTD